MAGSKADAFENELLLLIFNNTDIGTIGDTAGIQGSTTAGNFYLSLHTSDPLDSITGGITSTETSYGSYARKAVARSGAGWTVTGNSVSPAADQDFVECSGTPGAAITHFAVCAEATGDCLVLYHGDLSPSITMSTGVIPRIKSTSTITES